MGAGGRLGAAANFGRLQGDRVAGGVAGMRAAGERVGGIFAEGGGFCGVGGGVAAGLGVGGLAGGFLHYFGFAVAVEGAIHAFITEDGVGDGFLFDVAVRLLGILLGVVGCVWSFALLFLAASCACFHELADMGFRFLVLVQAWESG